MRVSDLSGADLDYWVAKALGLRAVEMRDGEVYVEGRQLGTQWSTDGQFGVPIIDRERIATSWGDAWQQSEIKDDGRTWHVVEKTPAQWYAYMVLDPVEAMRRLPEGARLTQHEYRVRGTGPTLLIAAMRCFVASRFGEVTPDRETTQ